ncbi:WD40 repeat-like protein [Paxillus ammoniavirescens]|nr:WD40 repeat-like protein [Paxillus ammoniavirescens]
MPSVDMHASSRSASPDSPRVSSVVPSAPSQLAPPENRTLPVQVFEGHGSSVTCASFFPDENKLVSGSDDGTLRIWDRKTGGIEVLKGHTGPVCEVDVSPDGSMVVSGSHDKTVRIFKMESGNTVQVLEGHEGWVRSVEFSWDSRRVASGSWDGTLRVWSVETGNLAFKPIECSGSVWCVRYSPTSGDRIASGANSVQIWNAETGIGILEISNLNFITTSLAWTVDDTHLIVRDLGNITIWNSQNGEQLRTWNVRDTTYASIRLSLSPTQTHLVTRDGSQTAFEVFDISTGVRVATLEHDQNVDGVAYSPSGNFIATGCEDNKVYLWEAPAVEDPETKSPASSISSFLDQPAIPTGPSRNDERGVDEFWGNTSNRDHQASPQPQGGVLNNKVKDKVKFIGLFARRAARAATAAHTTVFPSWQLRPDHRTQPCIPQSPARETIELVEVAAGKDRPYVAIIDPPKFNRLQKILWSIINCRKPDEEEEEVATAPGTTVDPPQAAAGKRVIDTQPQRNEMVAGPCSAPSPIPKTSMVSAYSQPTPQTDALLPVVTQARFPVPTSSTATVAPLNSSHPTSSQSLHHVPSHPFAITLSPEELAMVQDHRRRRAASARAAEPLPAHDRESYVDRGSSTSLSQSPLSATPSPSSTTSDLCWHDA